MSYVYAAYSPSLNRRSWAEVGQVYLFKFGSAASLDDLEERLNRGFEERRVKSRLGQRSAPLALCTDWEVIDSLEHDPRIEAEQVEGAIHTWCKKLFSTFLLADTIRREVNATAGQPYPSLTYVSWNGLGDIVCLDHDKVLDGNHMRLIGSLDNPFAQSLVDTAIARIRRELPGLRRTVDTAPTSRGEAA